MKVIGYNIKTISAEKINEIKDKLQISSNISIKSIKEEKIELIKDKTPLSFDFEFTLDYKPNFATIIIKGNVLILFDNKQAKEILKKWKSKKIDDDIRVPLFNFIFSKSSIKAIQLEEELSLPYHIPLPRLKQQSNTNYTG